MLTLWQHWILWEISCKRPTILGLNIFVGAFIVKRTYFWWLDQFVEFLELLSRLLSQLTCISLPIISKEPFKCWFFLVSFKLFKRLNIRVGRVMIECISNIVVERISNKRVHLISHSYWIIWRLSKLWVSATWLSFECVNVKWPVWLTLVNAFSPQALSGKQSIFASPLVG